MKNALGVEVPKAIAGLGELKPFEIVKYKGTYKEEKTLKNPQRSEGKVVKDLEEAIKLSGLKDGMTISFHHHFRNGDYIVNMVVDTLARLGFKDLVLASSSLSDVHSSLIEHIKSGVIKRIETSGMRGELANEVSKGLMDSPVIFRSHGGRATAIRNGELKIDVAFLGVPSTDVYGNANGFSRNGKNDCICGSLGYGAVDAQYAKNVILLTNNLVEYPNTPSQIQQTDVDYIVEVENIGDAKGIMSGATRITKNPKELLIAKKTAEVMKASGYLKDRFSFQTGTGGASLAVVRFLKEIMLEQNIKASYALGGITGHIAQLHQEGLIEKLIDVQCFDLVAAESVQNDPFHYAVDAYYYATPDISGAAVDMVDMVVLSALEIDLDFNVNVLTGSDGVIRGALGGHPDTAAGSSMTIVVAPLIRGRIPTVHDRVNTICTPGCTVDVFITDMGIAVNPNRQDLIQKLSAAGFELKTMEELKNEAEAVVGVPEPIKYTDKIVGIANYRDNTVLDIIYATED